jgi:hypothetical protein
MAAVGVIARAKREFSEVVKKKNGSAWQRVAVIGSGWR